MATSLDDVDLRILLALQGDPRMPVSKVARLVALTDNAVRYRMRRMQQAGILRGFAVLLDPRLLGRPRLGLVLVQLQDAAEIPRLLDAFPEVCGAYHTEGPYTACLYVCLGEHDSFERIAAELRRRPGVLDAVVLRVLEGHRAPAMPLVPVPLGLESPKPPVPDAP